jgi:phosphate transport system protein
MERHHFEEDLQALKQRLLHMGALVEEHVHQAVDALMERRLDLAERVAASDKEVNDLQIEIDDRALKLLALQNPLATDLRLITAAMKINADLERIGDLAVNIAEAARRYFSAGKVAEQQLLPRMSEIAEAMLADALKAFITNNLGTAQAVLERDDTLDSLRDQVNRRLVDLMRLDPDALSSALELMLIGRHLERTGDHATNIAEDVFFVVAGEDIRHQVLGIPDVTGLRDAPG